MRSFIRGRYIFCYNQTSRVVAFVPRSMEKTTACESNLFPAKSPLFVINRVIVLKKKKKKDKPGQNWISTIDTKIVK